jgi:histidinol dehydrogenase
MMKFVDARTENIAEILAGRSVVQEEKVGEVVADIIANVRDRGDTALLDSARKFDAPHLTSIHVSAQEMDEASVERPLFEALRMAMKRVQHFHLNQLEVILQGWHGVDLNLIPDVLELRLPRRKIDARWAISKRPSTVPNQFPRSGEFGVGQRLLSLDAAGVYVPGGRAVYPSSVLMNVGPASVAQVSTITVATPAQADGTLNPAVLVAMREIGVNNAIKIGGAAAIAALALGTETVSRVDKIVGPGNKFVNEAKRQLWGQCGFDGYAGSSEVCVLVDADADAKFAAIDFLTQIEHAPDNAGFLVSWSKSKLDEIITLLPELAKQAKDPEGTLAAMRDHGLVILVEDANQAVEVINQIAPEHLSLSVENPENLLSKVQTAGCVLIGEWTPESAGDYIVGPSHTLPTAGAGRWQSPVNVMDFLKFQSVSKLTADDLQELIAHVDVLANAEGFTMHALGATSRRLNNDHLSEVRGC